MYFHGLVYQTGGVSQYAFLTVLVCSFARVLVTRHQPQPEYRSNSRERQIENASNSRMLFSPRPLYRACIRADLCVLQTDRFPRMPRGRSLIRDSAHSGKLNIPFSAAVVLQKYVLKSFEAITLYIEASLCGLFTELVRNLKKKSDVERTRVTSRPPRVTAARANVTPSVVHFSRSSYV